jgi:hypothetical protein
MARITLTDRFGRTWVRVGAALETTGIHLDFGRELSDEAAQAAFSDYPPAGWVDRDNLRAEKIEAIKAYRDKLSEQGGYSVDVGGVAKWFHSDTKSKTQQLGLVMMGEKIPPVPWKTMDGTHVTMSAGIALAVFHAAAAQDMAIFAAAEAHIAAINASETPESYDFDSGWPSTYEG